MGKYSVKVNGVVYDVEIEELESANRAAVSAAPSVSPAPKRVESAAANAPKPLASAAAANSISSPLPGTILRVNVAPGQAVKKGDVLVTIEAMKMENDVMAVSDGVVASVCVNKGQTVETGDVLVTF